MLLKFYALIIALMSICKGFSPVDKYSKKNAFLIYESMFSYLTACNFFPEFLPPSINAQTNLYSFRSTFRERSSKFF